ncbi:MULTISPECIES: alginate export family protein [Alphaproteobacteria]|jgi:hypothetical protein|nr:MULTISPECIES: alginate export family protein [Sphingomonadaceae]
MGAFSGAVTGFLIVACACEASAQESAAPAVRDKPREEKGVVSQTSSGSRVTPENEPYPMQAAGWGPAAGPFFVERWAEDWSRLRRDGEAPALKAMPLIGDDVTLTLSAEARVRIDAYDDAALMEGNDFSQLESRVVTGADMHLGEHLRVYGELGSAQVGGHGNGFTPNYRGTVTPGNYRNDVAVQQLFAEAATHVGDYLIGAMVGRMEFSDGPRQLIAISDGPNLHRTWNGLRTYVHGRNFRVGAFSYKVTRLGNGAFDEQVNGDERLKGVNASIVVARGKGAGNIYLDPFLFVTSNVRGLAGPSQGADKRKSFGIRLWGSRGPVSVDWTAIRQTGEHKGRNIDAWAASLVQSVLVKEKGVRVRAGFRLDMGSGGNSFDPDGPIKSFNQLYASSNYLGEGLLISQSNVAILAPTIAVIPTRGVTITADYAFLHRLARNDAVYGGLMRPYAGTQNVSGRTVGSQARVVASWAVNDHVTLSAESEHLFAGNVLKRAGYGGGTYGMMSLTLRY